VFDNRPEIQVPVDVYEYADIGEHAVGAVGVQLTADNLNRSTERHDRFFLLAECLAIADIEKHVGIPELVTCLAAL